MVYSFLGNRLLLCSPCSYCVVSYSRTSGCGTVYGSCCVLCTLHNGSCRRCQLSFLNLDTLPLRCQLKTVCVFVTANVKRIRAIISRHHECLFRDLKPHAEYLQCGFALSLKCLRVHRVLTSPPLLPRSIHYRNE